MNRSQMQRETQSQEAQRERELAIAEQHAQDDALQAYLDHMSELLLHGNLLNLHEGKEDEGKEVGILARARTLTILERLDKKHKRHVLQFLKEAHLIPKDRTIILLNEANLKDAHLRDLHLENTNLRGVYLYGADLRGAHLKNVDLKGARLDLADLDLADLREVDLRYVRGLTEPQIEQAIGDPKTQLPGHLKRPKLWSTMGDEEQRQELEEEQTKRRANADLPN